MTLPRVGLIGTGGSIAFTGRDPLDLFEYGIASPMVDVHELIRRVPDLSRIADVVGVDFGQLMSNAISPTDWLALARSVHEVARSTPDLAGIVISHGTASLEETAYFLNLTLKVRVPVVVLGAQRPLVGLSSDGPLNLLNGVRVAASADCRNLGVLVVLNGEIHAARDVTKGSTYALDAFRSPGLGMLGHVGPDGSVIVYRKPIRRRAPDTEFEIESLTVLPRVDIVSSYVGSDDLMIRAAMGGGARGIVSIGYVPGVVSPVEMAALSDARREGIIVVQCSRSAGRVIARSDQRERGFVAGDDLTAPKARVLAMLGLTVTSDPVRIQGFFNDY